MSKEQEQRQKAIHFAQSIRGQFILSQALTTAITVMDEQEYPEFSNIEDMKFLRENLFHLFQKISTDKKATAEKLLADYSEKVYGHRHWVGAKNIKELLDDYGEFLTHEDDDGNIVDSESRIIAFSPRFENGEPCSDTCSCYVDGNNFSS